MQSLKDPMPSTDTGRCWSVLSSCRNGGGEGQGSGSQLTGHTVDGFEGPQDAHGADGRQVDVLKVQRVLDHPAEKGGRVRDTAGGTLRAHLCPQLPRGERHPGSESLLWPTQLCGLGCHLFCKGTWWHLPPTALGIPVNAVGAEQTEEPWVPTECPARCQMTLALASQQPLDQGRLAGENQGAGRPLAEPRDDQTARS